MILRQLGTPTTVQAGPGAWAGLRRSLGDRALVLADARVPLDVPAVRVDAGRTGLAAVREVAGLLTERAPRLVVGIGGGAVLDLVKLACLLHAQPAAADLLGTWGTRAGAIPLSAPAKSPVRRVLVPTTVGTGAEVSPVACVRIGDSHRIVAAPALRPDLAVLDPELTATLPGHLVREGVLEALLRVAGPVVGSEHRGGLPDAEAALLVRELVAVGDRVADGDVGPDARLAVATLSAATHTGWALSGREPYAARHWYLANELATVLGVRKMVATACLLPAVWRRVSLGDTRYGHAAGLAGLGRWLGVPDPVRGLEELLDRWRIDHTVAAAPEALQDAAERAVRSWGGRFPMLAGLTVADVAGLYAEATGVACLA
ncbi:MULTISPECIES: daptide-type RiPP biosynthesis dehydogenase [Amycolatopsis]|uniref:NADP-dependent alcohol dehydrogenase n=2 Tax=Amycolatopsis TaxID=1813 RepID=A0A1I4DHN0_9PSEU|nr:daptide-type RiPP biosynthesis dehydogenase [Amycolatopsis sacchari]SFK92399.1 NADP-dependent alcohol dehydrogenase [Amycolatopsis sacchari]